MGDYIGDYYRGSLGGYEEFRLWLTWGFPKIGGTL